jgi:hypothetical protein
MWMKPTLARELDLDALLMAVWRRRPQRSVIGHSDQGTQYGSDDWLRFRRANNLEFSMSRRGNCWDTQYTMMMNDPAATAISAGSAPRHLNVPQLEGPTPYDTVASRPPSLREMVATEVEPSTTSTQISACKGDSGR